MKRRGQRPAALISISAHSLRRGSSVLTAQRKTVQHPAQRPLPDGALRIVARGVKKDGDGAET